MGSAEPEIRQKIFPSSRLKIEMNEQESFVNRSLEAWIPRLALMLAVWEYVQDGSNQGSVDLNAQWSRCTEGLKPTKSGASDLSSPE